MFFDPMYFLFILPGLGLSLWASARVKRTFNRYAKVWSRRGFTGAQAAVALLRGAGITDVQIVRAHGVLSDHYGRCSYSENTPHTVAQWQWWSSGGVCVHH